MTGMWIFDGKIVLMALGAMAAAAHASDELVLRGFAREKLSGTVVGIEESGVIVLSSPLSVDPLRLRPNTVARVSFGTENTETSLPNMLVELANGDRLPVEVQSFTSKAGMRVASPVVGDLVLPASSLSALELGVPVRRKTFDGPGATAEWKNTRKDGFDNVTVEAKDWSVSGPMEASRQIEMPKNFVLRFQLGWEQRQQPNIKFYFATPDVGTTVKADRYFLQFGNAGFEIKREKTEGSGFPSILISNRRPDEFTGRQVEVEIHVNRTTKRIELYLNGQLEERGRDPMDQTPEGSGLILTANGMNGATHVIRNLVVEELKDMRVRHRAEDRGNPAADSLISRDEERWSGELKEIRRNGNDTDFLFQTAQRREPLEVPLEDVSTVFFRKPSKALNDEPTKYRLQLRGEGILSVKSCRISEEKITVLHPLLGELNLPKQAILRIEPADIPDTKKEESE